MEDKDYSLCIETVSGKLVNPAAPRMEDISIDDIAWALSRIPRFAGHTITKIPYNVAQHSIHVSILAEQLGPSYIAAGGMGSVSNVCLKALFHDAHEAYFGDIPSPIKRISGLTERFKEIEAGLDSAIFGAIGLLPITQEEKQLIKHCDKLAQAIEGYHFMPSRGFKWDLPKPSRKHLQEFEQPLSAAESYEAFIKRYEYLGGQ